MRTRLRLESERVLAVEGKAEVSFFKALLKHEQIEGIQLLDIGGKDRFAPTLSALVNHEGFSRIHTIGFIRDAEELQAESAFASVCHALASNALPVPQTINTVFHEDRMRTGIFIMPNNIDAGMLEDLCLASVQDEPVFHCVEQYISCCLQDRSFHVPKAKVQSFLSIQKPSVKSLGLGALKGYWNFQHECCDDIKSFLHELLIAE